MMSKIEAGKKRGEGSNGGKLLNEIEAISKALYLDKNPSKVSVSKPNNARSKSTGKAPVMDTKPKIRCSNDESTQKDKKSIWNWKPLKALSNAKSRRFTCCFSLQVHSIERLPVTFNDLSLCVHWKRRDEGLATHPTRVLNGKVEFEEKLTHTCSVYGSRSGPHHSAKYEAKHFLLYASISGAPELDLGKHRVDLTRLLPLTLEELEEEKSSGKWTTSFKLSGKAKGATMNVSFAYTVVGDNSSTASGNNQNVNEVSNTKQNNLSMLKPVAKFGLLEGKNTVRRVESLPVLNQKSRALFRSMEDIKDLHEVLPASKSELATSVDTLYQKFDEEKLENSVDNKQKLNVSTEDVEPIKVPVSTEAESGKDNAEKEEDNEFSIIEQGVELSSEKEVKSETVKLGAAADRAETSPEEVDFGIAEQEKELCGEERELPVNGKNGLHVQDSSPKGEDISTKESLMKELELALNCVSDMETDALDSPDRQESCTQIEMDHNTNRLGRSRSLDDVTESEFLNMLGIEHSPSGLSSESEAESPRERLLREFEKETLAGGCSLFDFNIGGEEAECVYDAPRVREWANTSDDFELSSIIQAAEEEHWMATQDERNKIRATVLEDMETEALMREWGLNEKAFQCSPPKAPSGFGSPIDLPPEEPLELPPLGEGLGPFLQTNNGGFLRSMSPSLFNSAKSGGSLIMQVSRPVVVPAEKGSGIMEILQKLASAGIEKLSMQANKLMPLEEITGKTMHQIAWEAAPALAGPESQYVLQNETQVGQDLCGVQKRVKGRPSATRSDNFGSTSASNQMGSEYVSLEDLAPLAMDKIEALSMEGLRIQSGMSNEDAPSNISAQFIGEISALQGKGDNFKSGCLGLEGTAGLQLMDMRDNGDEVDGLMGLSLTLDEWMRLDSGEIYDEDQISERTSKILAAHHANSLDLIRGGSKGERRRTKGRKCGLLGNNFTVALMVQLRDPLRNYEPVGTPMLSLIQVERIFVPPKPKIYVAVSEIRSNNNGEDDEDDLTAKKELKKEVMEEKALEDEGIPQYKITEVHVAGLKTEFGKKKLWGNTTQQQSGSRWLLANGMGKSNKHPFLKSKAASKSAAPATAKAQPGDTLWSISSRVLGNGSKWKELAELNPHIRNPNVIFPNETIRLR